VWRSQLRSLCSDVHQCELRVCLRKRSIYSQKQGEPSERIKPCVHARKDAFYNRYICLSAEGCLVWQIEEAEHRLNYAQHYGIAYPRLHHASQFKRRVYMDVPQQGGSGASISLPR